MKVLGVDPGLQITGYALLERSGGKILIRDAGVIRVSPALPMPKRLRQLHQEAAGLIEEYHPDLVAVEELYAHYKHPRTAILMGHARGVFLLAAAQHNIDVRGYAATRVKKSLTGSGRAAKSQMQAAVTTQLKLKTIPSPPDVADALAIALCCLEEIHREKLLA